MALGKKSAISANDDALEESVALFEEAAVFGGILVLLGLAAEIALLVWPVENQRLADELASCFVALGVGIEVLFGKMASRRQGTLVQRSKERVTQLENANLLLKKQLGPRQLDSRAVVKALEGQPKAPVEVLYVLDNPECQNLASEISFCLSVAKWDCSPALAVSSILSDRGFLVDAATAAGGNNGGVTVVRSDTISKEEADALPLIWEGRPTDVRAPDLAIIGALREGGLTQSGWSSTGKTAMIPLRDGWVRVIVAPRG